MKRWNNLGMAILGMLFLTFMFTACQKDEGVMPDINNSLEIRGKACTRTYTNILIKVEVASDVDGLEVWNALHSEFRRVMNSTNNKIVFDQLQNAWQDLIDDRSEMDLAACNHISATICDPDVYGFEMPLIAYTVSKGQLHFVVINVELVEQGCLACYEDHEDFHAYIADAIIKQCTEEAVSRTGLDCANAGEAAQATLQSLNDEAQTLYDVLTENGSLDNNRAAARTAVKDVVSNFIGS